MKIILTIDVEKNGNIRENLKNLEIFLKKQKLKTIFLVTGECLEEYPEVFRKLKKQGYEIGLHGYFHERLDILDKKEKEKRINRAIKIYKKIFHCNPKWFRAPQFSADFELLGILNKKNFKYDSSIVQFPLSQIIFFPRRFSLYFKQCFFQKKIKKRKMKIKEIPVSSFILPMSMFSLKILPIWFFTILAKLSLFFRRDKKFIFLIHSYELNEKNLNKIEKFLNLISQKY